MFIGGIIFFLVGIVNILNFCKLFFTTIASKKWHKTFGKITASQIKKESFGSEITEQGYVHFVKYSYVVKGVNYSSTIKNFGINFHLPFSNPINPNYKVGEEITVIFNPKNPSKSTLDNSLKIDIFLYLIFGIISITLAVYLFSGKTILINSFP